MPAKNDDALKEVKKQVEVQEKLIKGLKESIQIHEKIFESTTVNTTLLMLFSGLKVDELNQVIKNKDEELKEKEEEIAALKAKLAGQKGGARGEGTSKDNDDLD